MGAGLDAHAQYAGDFGVLAGEVFGGEGGYAAGSHRGYEAAVHNGGGFAGFAVQQDDGGERAGEVVLGGVVFVHGDGFDAERAGLFELGGHKGVPAVVVVVGQRGALGHNGVAAGKLDESALQQGHGVAHSEQASDGFAVEKQAHLSPPAWA